MILLLSCIVTTTTQQGADGIRHIRRRSKTYTGNQIAVTTSADLAQKFVMMRLSFFVRGLGIMHVFFFMAKRSSRRHWNVTRRNGPVMRRFWKIDKRVRN